MFHKPASSFAAAVSGALVALLIAYALSLCGLWAGLVDITRSDSPTGLNIATLQRAGLNLYAVQHVALMGSGTVTSDFAGTQPVTTKITLPLTLWAVIPAVALLVGGLVAGLRRRGTGTAGIALTAVLTGIVYAALLVPLSYLFQAQMDPSALPSIGGVDFNPPPIPLHPAPLSTAHSAGLFGVIFAGLGGMAASRRERERVTPNRWWACGKAIVLTASALILFVILSLGAWLAYNPPDDIAESNASWDVFTISPTAAGAVYSLIYGSTVVVAVESPLQSEDDALGGRANLYRGVLAPGAQGERKPVKPAVVYAGVFVGLLAAFVAGWLAVRWGSRDGSLQTGLRIAVVFSLLMLVLAALCGFGWTSTEGEAAFTLSVALKLGWPFAAALGAVLVTSMAGSLFASSYYSSRRGFPTDL